MSKRVGYILHEELDMKKLCARWVPRLLSADQKRTRMKISEQCLERFDKSKNNFVRRRFITMDETWIRHYAPESKQQSEQWTEAGFSAPKTTSLVPSAGKVMTSVFWDAESILFIDYFEKGKTITGEYYSNILIKLDENIREKKAGLQKKKSFFIRTMHPPTNCFGNGKVKGSALWIVGTSTLFPRFGSL
jgi:histone-lysine N-methyltransferase SETMAR